MKRFWPVALFLILGLAACANTNPVETNQPTTNPTSANTTVGTPAPDSSGATNPSPGKASIEGRILSSNDGKPLAATTVWLARIYGDGTDAQFVLNGSESPNTTTTSTGTFTIENVDAASYVIIVGDPYAKNVIVSNSSGKAKVWELPAAQTVNAQDIRVNLGR